MSDWRDTFNSTAAAPAGKEYDKIPEGTYFCEIFSARINEANQYGARVEMELVIADGDFTRRKLWHNYNLNEKGISFLKADMLKLGHRSDTAEELERSLESLLGASIVIALKYKSIKNEATGLMKEYQQVFVNGLKEVIPF